MINLIKQILKSKTLIVNLVALFAMSASYLTGQEVSQGTQNELVAWVLNPENQVVILAFVNIILRFFTKKPVSEKKSLME